MAYKRASQLEHICVSKRLEFLLSNKGHVVKPITTSRDYGITAVIGRTNHGITTNHGESRHHGITAVMAADEKKEMKDTKLSQPERKSEPEEENMENKEIVGEKECKEMK